MRHAELAAPISRRLRATPLLCCITEVRLITFRSAILARSVKISSCTPSVKKRVGFFFAQIFEWEQQPRFFRNTLTSRPQTLSAL